MGRSREEVQEFVVSRVEKWLCDMIEQGEGIEEQQVLWDLRDDMNNNKMLLKPQAMLLDERLEEECRIQTEVALCKSGRLVLAIDELSIYADAWAQYCRPGTYMIVM